MLTFQLSPVLVLLKKEDLLGQGDRPLTAGTIKDPSHATPNNQLAALGSLVLCLSENVLTVIIFVYVNYLL